MARDLAGSSALADAAALGLPALASVLAGAQEGITIVDASRRWVYANPAACRMLGRPAGQPPGQDFLSVVPAREHNIALGRHFEQLGGTTASSMFTGPDGAERESVYSTFGIDIAGSPHVVVIFRDVTGTRAAARTAMALAQTAAQLTGSGTADEILAGIARHAVEGIRALACGIDVVNNDHELAFGGGALSARAGLREPGRP